MVTSREADNRTVSFGKELFSVMIGEGDTAVCHLDFIGTEESGSFRVAPVIMGVLAEEHSFRPLTANMAWSNRPRYIPPYVCNDGNLAALS